ncbi:MAG: NUDIX domain-containing protein [Erysipelotrichaceae bacterium]|nr:NUDIX domain-containing protein [Erysipelotrichaceae bacterium]
MIILTNMCLIRNGNMILVQNRTKKDWPGLTLPGGKVEKDESVYQSVLREVYEETGLRLLSAKDVGYIEWLIDGDRHLCILFESESYEGELKSNDEGEDLFIDIKDLCQYQFSTDFDKILDIYGIIY